METEEVILCQTGDRETFCQVYVVCVFTAERDRDITREQLQGTWETVSALCTLLTVTNTVTCDTCVHLYLELSSWNHAQNKAAGKVSLLVFLLHPRAQQPDADISYRKTQQLTFICREEKKKSERSASAPAVFPTLLRWSFIMLFSFDCVSLTLHPQTVSICIRFTWSATGYVYMHRVVIGSKIMLRCDDNTVYLPKKRKPSQSYTCGWMQ